MGSIREWRPIQPIWIPDTYVRTYVLRSPVLPKFCLITLLGNATLPIQAFPALGLPTFSAMAVRYPCIIGSAIACLAEHDESAKAFLEHLQNNSRDCKMRKRASDADESAGDTVSPHEAVGCQPKSA